MKNLLKIAVLSLLISTQIACEKSGEKETDSKMFQNFKVDLSSSKLGEQNSAILFTYENVHDLYDKSNETIKVILEEIEEYKLQNSSITEVSFKVEIANGQAILSELYYLDGNTKSVVAGYVYDETTSAYLNVSTNDLGSAIDDMLLGSCNNGMVQIKSCPDSAGANSVKECASSEAATFFSENLTGINSCANVQISVGLISTKVCGKKC